MKAQKNDFGPWQYLRKATNMLKIDTALVIASSLDGLPRVYQVHSTDAYETVLLGPDGLTSRVGTRALMIAIADGKITVI